MDEVKGKVGKNDVTVALGDMTQIPADAYVVPEFRGGASFGGVGGAVARNGGEKGLDAYQEFVDKNGEQNYGTVLLTPSGGGKSKHILHVVSVGSSEAEEFGVIQAAFYNALKTAEANGLKKIVAPAMGTGIIGALTGKQSAEAMMSAVHLYEIEGGSPLDVSFVIYGDRKAHQAFSEALATKSYEAPVKQSGQKEFNPEVWKMGMEEMVETQGRFSAKFKKKRSSRTGRLFARQTLKL